MKKIIRFDGAKLRQCRKGLELTQYDLAPMIGISQNRVSDIERNVTDPTPEEIDKFASALNVKASDLLSDEKDIVVITKTFTKGKNKQDKEQPQGFDGIEIYPETEQLELFTDDVISVGTDLSGYVLVKQELYLELLDNTEKLHKMQKLLK